MIQKNPRVRKILVRNSGAGNGCANFMDTWKKCVLSAGKTHVHKIPPFRGGILGFVGGGRADFIFMGAGIFLNDFRGFRLDLNWILVNHRILTGLLGIWLRTA